MMASPSRAIPPVPHVELAEAVAGEGGLDGLKRIADAIGLLESARSALIKELRDQEVASWAEIGQACGMTKQSAHQRWSKHIRAGSFGLAAAAYQRGRPDYPEVAVDWVVPPGAREVLDLGAGTGQLTRMLLRRGLTVAAIEPSPDMRAEFARTVPEIDPISGQAESIDFPDSSFDAVLVAQAWHWVDPDRAVPEVARVLRPGGVLGILSNMWDAREPWVTRFHQIMRSRGVYREPNMSPKVPAPFAAAERMEVVWELAMTPTRLLDWVSSRTHIITLHPSDRTAVLKDVRHLLATHPDLAGAERFPMPMMTRCSRFPLRGRVH